MCRKGGAAAGAISGRSDFEKPLPPAIEHESLSFAKGTKKDIAEDSVVGMVMNEILSVSARVPSKEVE